MPFLSQKIPSYLTEKQNTIRLVGFTAIIALLFINVYAPFGVNTWGNINKWELLVYSSFVILTGVLMVAISRIVMFFYCKHNQLSILTYLLWVFMEILLMALVYSFFDKYILNDPRFFFDTLIKIIQYTALVIVIPYSAMWLYLSWQDKNDQLKEMIKSHTGSSQICAMVSFNDEKGQLKISIKTQDILYLKSADNYVFIFYRAESKISKYMLRTTMSKLEDELKKSKIIRCHRSYMVNIDSVKIIRKESDGLKLELDTKEFLIIPISKTYQQSVLGSFAKFPQN